MPGTGVGSHAAIKDIHGRTSGCHRVVIQSDKHEGPRMAKWCAVFFAAAVFALAGCQPQQPVAMVKTLPPPNFDGPADLTPPPPAPIVRPPGPVVTAPPMPSPKNPAG